MWLLQNITKRRTFLVDLYFKRTKHGHYLMSTKQSTSANPKAIDVDPVVLMQFLTQLMG
jgi:hypothetical protein